MLEFSSSNGLFVSWASEISSNQAPLLTGAVFSPHFSNTLVPSYYIQGYNNNVAHQTRYQSTIPLLTCKTWIFRDHNTIQKKDAEH